MNKKEKIRKLKRIERLTGEIENKQKTIRELASEIRQEEEKEEPEIKCRVGVSRREILNRANGDWHSLYGKPLEFFMELPVEYELKIVRVNSTHNLNLLCEYLDFMALKGIRVILTLSEYNDGKPYEFFGVAEDIIQATKHYDHIIYNPVNEPWSRLEVKRAWELCNLLEELELPSIQGEYGAGGKQWSELFDPIISNNTMISIHRSYENELDIKETVKPYKCSGKKISWDESFKISAYHWTNCCRWFKEEGVTIFNYYGTRSKELFPDLKEGDPDHWQLYYEKARQLQKEFNGGD